MDVEDLLHQIKYHPELTRTPVIVLTGLRKDLIETCDLDHDANGDAVLRNPINSDEFLDVIRSFDLFQLAVIQED